MMSESPQRFQIISTEPTTTPQRIQVIALGVIVFRDCDISSCLSVLDKSIWQHVAHVSCHCCRSNLFPFSDFGPVTECSFSPPSLFCRPPPSLTPSDCNWPADRSEDPDSDSDQAVQCSEAAVHSDDIWQLRGRQGYLGLTGQPQCQAAHLHCCRQPDARKDTGTLHTQCDLLSDTSFNILVTSFDVYIVL